MGLYLDIILQDNIIKPLNEKKLDKVVPTIIMAPRLSRDYSSYIDMLMQSIAQAPAVNRGLLNIITGIQGCDEAQFGDICDLCNCKYIKKYLDEEIHKKDIKSGLAPTRNTIHNFAGTADLVKSDAHKTTFVNPAGMYKADGSTSDLFNQRIDFLQGQIDKLTIEGNETTEIYNCKKRLNSLKGKMVEIYIGGVTVADRDAERDLMEDAVLNCRSAALNGVGYAANFEGLRAAYEIEVKNMTPVIYNTEQYFKLILESYIEISKMLYKTADSDNANEIVFESLKRDCPYNLVSKEYDKKVLTSIDTDVCILETISKIVTLMVTANQFILPTINMNQY
jgi:chaperonin GroEL (HSP60 family)